MQELDKQPLRQWLAPLEAIVREAGEAIMAVYEASGDLAVEIKADDSPLTAADQASHRIILERLLVLTPGIPVLSEESDLPSFDTRSQWRRYWLVDPLDGTKEFIGRNGEFTVNVALIEDHEPVLGLVYVPVQQILYAGVKGEGAWKTAQSQASAIRTRPLAREQVLNVVASRRHGAEALGPLLARAESRFAGVDHVSVGSSLKICLLAEGRADWYPRLALTSEWDTAAAQAVLEAAGGLVLDESLRPLRYNTKESLLNPFFHAVADPTYDWRSLLASQG